MRIILSLLLFCFGLPGLAYADMPKILKLSELKPDTRAIGFSVFEGIEPEPFDVVLARTVDQAGNSYIPARISGGPMETLLERIGAVSGMSGSPIFVGCINKNLSSEEQLDYCISQSILPDNDVFLVGALSYRVGHFIEGGVNVLLTPAEYMLGARLDGYMVTSQFSTRTPGKLNIGGSEFINLMLFPKMEGLISGGDSAGKCKDSANSKLKPGSMVSVFLAKGSIPFAASGTVTWVDGNKIYIFGHPFYGGGVVNLPFTHVSVAATLQTPFNAYKMSGCFLDTQGAMLVDGAFEMAGVIGRVAPMVPFRLEMHAGGNNGAVMSEQIASSPLASIILRQLPSIWAEKVFGDVSSLSLSYMLRIVLANEPEIFMKNIIPAGLVPIAEGNAKPPLHELLDRMEAVFVKLGKSGLNYEIESVRIHADFVNNMKVWRKKTAFLSQDTVAPGETIHANIVLEESSTGLVKQISIPVKVPDDFMARLESGKPSSITVLVQSSLRFTDKRRVDGSASGNGLVAKLKLDLDLPANVLYVQQIMYKTKESQETDKANSKSLTKAPWDWSDLNSGELRQIPPENNLESSLSTTPPLEHFIDLDETFNITVKKKEVEISTHKKNKRWYFLFLK